MAHSLGVIEFISMATFGSHFVSSVDMIAIVAHSTGIMLSINVLAVRHLLSGPPSFRLSGFMYLDFRFFF